VYSEFVIKLFVYAYKLVLDILHVNTFCGRLERSDSLVDIIHQVKMLPRGLTETFNIQHCNVPGSFDLPKNVVRRISKDMNSLSLREMSQTYVKECMVYVMGYELFKTYRQIRTPDQ
jgi:hypothetical protein